MMSIAYAGSGGKSIDSLVFLVLLVLLALGVRQQNGGFGGVRPFSADPCRGRETSDWQPPGRFRSSRPSSKTALLTVLSCRGLNSPTIANGLPTFNNLLQRSSQLVMTVESDRTWHPASITGLAELAR